VCGLERERKVQTYCKTRQAAVCPEKSVTILINEGHEETSNDIPIYTCNGWFFCEVLKDLYIDTSAVHMHLVWSYTPLGIDTDPADRYTSHIFKSRNPNQPVGTTNRPKIQRSNKFLQMYNVIEYGMERPFVTLRYS
jgi:hypothetical protein